MTFDIVQLASAPHILDVYRVARNFSRGTPHPYVVSATIPTERTDEFVNTVIVGDRTILNVFSHESQRIFLHSWKDGHVDSGIVNSHIHVYYTVVMYTYKKCYVGFCTPRCTVMDSKKKKRMDMCTWFVLLPVIRLITTLCDDYPDALRLYPF